MPFITQGKTNLKYILIVVILAVIVGGGILGYYYSWIADLEVRLAELELRIPQKFIKENETANWKFFTGSLGDPTINYSFKYPEKLKVAESPGSGRYGVANSIDNVVLNREVIPGRIEFSLDFLPGYFHAYVRGGNLAQIKEREEHGEEILISNKKAVLVGKEAKRVLFKNRYNETIELLEYIAEFDFQGRKRGISFTCYFVRSSTENLEELCDKMASTLKFIE